MLIVYRIGNGLLADSVDICRKSHRLDECGTRPCFRWVQTQGYSSDTLGMHNNASGPVDIPLKISLVPPEAWGCRSWRARHEFRLPGIHVGWPRPTVTGTRPHPTRFVYPRTRLTEVCLSPAVVRWLFFLRLHCLLLNFICYDTWFKSTLLQLNHQCQYTTKSSDQNSANKYIRLLELFVSKTGLHILFSCPIDRYPNKNISFLNTLVFKGEGDWGVFKAKYFPLSTVFLNMYSP